MSGDLFSSDGGDLTAFGLAICVFTDLANYTDSLRAVIARPGTFSDLFPETNDDMLVGVLADALAECHLEATLLENEADANSLVQPPLSSGQVALVILYGGLRLIRAELLNRVTSAKYVAGPVSAETTQATNILRDIMKALQTQKDRLTALISARSGAGASFAMADSYVANVWGFTPNGVPLADWLPPLGYVNAMF